GYSGGGGRIYYSATSTGIGRIACLDSSSIQMEAPQMMILNPPETGSDSVRDEEPAASQIICENGDCTTINVELSFIKTNNSYINPDLILKSRTRSGLYQRELFP
ncbi:Hypothetical protein FKW44_005132, partial [Caligus rogercresseyi]